MRLISTISVVLLLIIFIPLGLSCLAQNEHYESPTIQSEYKPFLFQGVINADNINIRSDSTVNSKIICKVNKGSLIEVVRKLYDWYKIRLPKTAPSFIKKDLVIFIGDKTAKVLKDNVNIRLFPSESSWILGRANKNEVVNILQEQEEWYKIEPVNNSFGWIHQNFVDKATTINKTEEIKLTQGITRKENKIVSENPVLEENTFEGTIKPYGKVLKRKTTHKLITKDNRVFLLKGDKESLDSLNYHKVKITGKLIGPEKQKYPVIEIIKIEALD